MEYPEAPTRGEKTGILNRLFYGGPSLEALHEEYAKKGRIDEAVPVKASREVRIEAPVGRVWELLSDPHGWGTWYPDIHDVRLDSAVMADARFTLPSVPTSGYLDALRSPPTHLLRQQHRHRQPTVARGPLVTRPERILVHERRLSVKGERPRQGSLPHPATMQSSHVR